MIFLHADKHESFLQNYMNFDGMVKHSQSFQNSKCAMALRFLKKAARYEVDFLHTDKHQSFCKLTLFLMEVARHVQITQK